ncbi:MAG: hypothetical protein LBQ66_03415 [Planctomycetaceae bacterium]|nr:hypothetical protein [Planctomycetaceae bacterium]
MFGSIMHRGGRDARVPVRRRFAANLTRASRPRSSPLLLRGNCRAVLWQD